MDFPQLLSIFTTGVLAGGLSCMAVQGGLLATVIAQHKPKPGETLTQSRIATFLPISIFLLAKLLAYTILGFLLGWFGSLFQLSLPLQLALQIAVGVFLLGTALHLLNIHPLFRYFAIQPPRFINRFIRKESKRASLFAPAVLGLATVLIPCGATQAVMVLSIASGSAFVGALIMFAFTLGTIPLFLGAGYLAAGIGVTLRQSFAKAAAFVLLIFAVYIFNNSIALSGSHLTLENFARGGWCLISYCENQYKAPINNNPEIIIDGRGYTPRALTIAAGQPITLTLHNLDSVSCPQAFTIPALGIQKVVPLGESATVSFTAPKEPGVISFMCSSGLYRGTISVL